MFPDGIFNHSQTGLVPRVKRPQPHLFDLLLDTVQFLRKRRNVHGGACRFLLNQWTNVHSAIGCSFHTGRPHVSPLFNAGLAARDRAAGFANFDQVHQLSRQTVRSQFHFCFSLFQLMHFFHHVQQSQLVVGGHFCRQGLQRLFGKRDQISNVRLHRVFHDFAVDRVHGQTGVFATVGQGRVRDLVWTSSDVAGFPSKGTFEHRGDVVLASFVGHVERHGVTALVQIHHVRGHLSARFVFHDDGVFVPGGNASLTITVTGFNDVGGLATSTGAIGQSRTVHHGAGGVGDGKERVFLKRRGKTISSQGHSNLHTASVVHGEFRGHALQSGIVDELPFHVLKFFTTPTGN